MVARSDHGRSGQRHRNGGCHLGAASGDSRAGGQAVPVVAEIAACVCWFCMGGGGRWWDGVDAPRHHAAYATDGGGICDGVLRGHHKLGGHSVDRSNVFAAQQGLAENHSGRRIAWHLVGAAVALFVGLVSLSIAWAGATANYQARIEREQLQMLAAPRPAAGQSSYVLATGWHGEVLLP